MGRTRMGIKRFPAPIGGLNARDALVEMPEQDAVILENWWPETTRVRSRKGCMKVSTTPYQYDTLVCYPTRGGVQHLFGFRELAVDEIAVNGNTYSTTPLPFQLSSKYSTTILSNTGGMFLLCLNGQDRLLYYNGSKWGTIGTSGVSLTISTISVTLISMSAGEATVTTSTPHGLLPANSVTITGTTGGVFDGTKAIARILSPTSFVINFNYGSAASSAVGSLTQVEVISGVDVSRLTSITVFANRIWFTEKNSSDVWYLDLFSIYGTAHKFPLGALLTSGGSLVACCTWTIDSGMGVDDKVVFFSSEGQAVVYRGTDPASATTFFLSGTYDIAKPIGGALCCLKYMGDIYFLTEFGILPLSKAILTAQITAKSDITDKVYPLLQQAISENPTATVWEMCVYPIMNMLILNTPDKLEQSVQYCMNTITGAWTKFTGWKALSFTIVENDLYFSSSDGYVYQGLVSDLDDSKSIPLKVLQAFSPIESASTEKLAQLLKLVLYTNGSPSIQVGINVNYDTTLVTESFLSFSPVSSDMVWGSMVWGSMVWGSAFYRHEDWEGVSGMGYSMAIAVNASNNNSDISWLESILTYESGGVL